MGKSILLEKQKQVLSIFMAVIFCLNGLVHLLHDDLSSFRITLGILMTLIGLYYIFYSLFGFSVKSKYAAKLRVTDETIELRTKFWIAGSVTTVNWADVRSIHFGNYKVDFGLSNGTKSVTYNTTSEKSIQLKQLLRVSAEQRNIPVTGG